MFNTGRDGALCGGAGAGLVSDEAPGKAAPFSWKPRRQAPGGLGVPLDLDDFVKDMAVRIDGPPEIAFLAFDRDHTLVEMPNVASARRFASQAADRAGPKFHPIFHRPAPDGFAGNHDGAFQQHFLDKAGRAETGNTAKPHER